MSLDERELDAVFLALASATRRQLLDLIAGKPGCTLSELLDQFPMSRIGLLKHLNVLEAAGLVLAEKVGRERPLYFNPVPLQLIHQRWDDHYRSFWAGQLTALKYAVESQPTETPPDRPQTGTEQPNNAATRRKKTLNRKPIRTEQGD